MLIYEFEILNTVEWLIYRLDNNKLIKYYVWKYYLNNINHEQLLFQLIAVHIKFIICIEMILSYP